MERGLALYTIDTQGCLHGTYTNDLLKGAIFNEIARMHTPLEGDELCGVYHSFYFDRSSVRNNAELTITATRNEGHCTYTFEWLDLALDKVTFHGTGYRMNKNQVAVYYWFVKE
jgi:hypothetical protein